MLSRNANKMTFGQTVGYPLFTLGSSILSCVSQLIHHKNSTHTWVAVKGDFHNHFLLTLIIVLMHGYLLLNLN